MKWARAPYEKNGLFCFCLKKLHGYRNNIHNKYLA